MATGVRRELQKRLLKWYERKGRKHLPWRRDADPYKVLVAEILLRKTRVGQALPVYGRILRSFPDPKALASASQRQIENLVGPIGLVSRALQLRRIGRKITEKHGGRIPSNRSSLQELPGVGRYIASSILVFGYGRRIPIVDGNVSRIYSRVLGRSRKENASRDVEMWQLAEEMLPGERDREYNAALLDFGALICTHHGPKCDQCPLEDLCCHSQGAISKRDSTSSGA